MIRIFPLHNQPELIFSAATMSASLQWQLCLEENYDSQIALCRMNLKIQHIEKIPH